MKMLFFLINLIYLFSRRCLKVYLNNTLQILIAKDKILQLSLDFLLIKFIYFGLVHRFIVPRRFQFERLRIFDILSRKMHFLIIIKNIFVQNITCDGLLLDFMISFGIIELLLGCIKA